MFRPISSVHSEMANLSNIKPKPRRLSFSEERMIKGLVADMLRHLSPETHRKLDDDGAGVPPATRIVEAIG